MESSRVYNYVKQGRIEELKGIYKSKVYEFNIGEERLEINDSGFGGYNIWVEREDTDDGKIEVFSYRTKSFTYGVDVTEKILLPDIEFRGNVLTIKPLAVRFEYTAFTNDFTVSQFIPEDDGISERMTFFDIQYIYLKIPKGLKINENNLNIDYVDTNLR